MPKQHPMTLAELKQWVDYDPATGRLTWIVKPNRRLRAGDEAGAIKALRISNGEEKRYRYFCLNGWTTPAARVAWLFITGEWPERNILFRDGDTLNLRADNLTLGDFTTTYVVNPDTGLRQKKMTREAARHYGLMRYYGIDEDEYNRLFEKQGGVCAVCGGEETRIHKGERTKLQVDHDHKTGEVRALLCFNCNNGLGAFRDDPDSLANARGLVLKEPPPNRGVPLHAYHEMIAAQGNRCAMCKQPEKAVNARGEIRCLVVDRDPKTQNVRALLCQRCEALITTWDTPEQLLHAAQLAAEIKSGRVSLIQQDDGTALIVDHDRGDNVIPLKPEGAA